MTPNGAICVSKLTSHTVLLQCGGTMYTTLEYASPLSVQTSWGVLERSDDPDKTSVFVNLPQRLINQLVGLNSGTYKARQSVIHPSGLQQGYAELRSGNPRGPEPSTLSYDTKFGIKTPNFKKRRLEGEILMSGYYAGRVKVTAYPGVKIDSSVSQSSRRGFALGSTPAGCYRAGKLGRVFINDGGIKYFHNSEHIFLATPSLVTRSFTNPVIPIHPSRIVQDFPSQNRVDTILVTGVISEANSQSLDLLTSLAEMPEAVRMFSDIISDVVKLTKDVKKGRVNILSRYREASRKLRDALNIDVTRVRNSSAKQKYKDKQIKHFQRVMNKELIKLTTDATSSMANLWLMYRYGIMPLVYTAEDIVQLRKDALSEYSTARSKITSDFALPKVDGWETNDKVDLVHRCVNKRRYFTDELHQRGISSTLSMDPITTLYELIPYSFVLDWFVNVGDFISASTGVDISRQEATSYSWKVDHVVSMVQPSTKRKTNYDLELYNREVLNPDDYVGLGLNIDLNPKRLADSAALLWRPLKQALINLKR